MRAISFAAHAFAFAIGFSAACADTVTVETASGPAEVPAGPEKVVVFDISVLDTLHALGVPVAGAPERIYVNYLDDAVKDAEPIGTLFEPDFEAINALQPDLIIAGGRSSKQLGALSDLAPAIDMTIWGDVLGQAKERIAAYGKIFGKEDKAKELAANLMKAVDNAKQTTKDGGTAIVLLTQGPKVTFYGPESRFGWLYKDLGIQPAVNDDKDSTHGEAISFEFIRDANPDWIIVIDRAAAIGQDAVLAAETLDNKLVAETNAWKAGQVIYLDAGKIYIAMGGYESTMQTISDVTSAFAKSN